MTIIVSTDDPRGGKALALLETAETWLKVRRKTDGRKFYVIPSSDGSRVYWTNCGECSCPDAAHRPEAVCKHRLAVQLYVARVKASQPSTPRRSRHQTPLSPAQADVAIAAASRLQLDLERQARQAANAATYHDIFGRDE